MAGAITCTQTLRQTLTRAKTVSVLIAEEPLEEAEQEAG